MSQNAVEDCTGIVSVWIQRLVSETTWAAYNKVWQEWAALGRITGVNTEGQEVRLLVLYFFSRNMEEG